MKPLVNIALLITLFSCKAQTIIVPLGSTENLEHSINYYEKDVNNEFGKFEGTWKYQSGSTQITLKLKKEVHYLSPSNYYTDMLVGEYQYIENGTEIANTLSDFNNLAFWGTVIILVVVFLLTGFLVTARITARLRKLK